MAERPDKLPRWAEDDVTDPVSGQPNVDEPPEERQDSGWERNEKPPRQWFNWLQRGYYRWLRWIVEERLDKATHEAIADRLAQRDGDGRLEVQDPNADLDAANKGYVDGTAQSQIDAHESSRNHPNATTSQPGFMSSGDKSKLNGVESGAQVNPSTTASRTSTSTTTVLQAAGMNNHRQSDDHDGRYYTKAEVESYADGTAQSQIDAHEASRNHPNATTSQPGFMSSGDKSKLNGVESGAQVNPPTTASRTSTSTTTVLQAAGMNNHRTSGDHDGRYYTQSQIDSMISGVAERPGVWWDTLASELVISTNSWTNILSVTVPAVASNERLLLIANINQRGGSNIWNTGFYRFTRNGSAVRVGTSGPGGMQATIAHGWSNNDRQIPGMMLGVVTAGTSGNVTIAVQCRSAGDRAGVVRINSADRTGNNHARTFSALAVVRLRSQ